MVKGFNPTIPHQSEVNHFPSSLSYLAKCEPVYKTFPGWSSSDIDIPNGIIPDEVNALATQLMKKAEETTNKKVLPISKYKNKLKLLNP